MDNKAQVFKHVSFSAKDSSKDYCWSITLYFCDPSYSFTVKMHENGGKAICIDLYLVHTVPAFKCGEVLHLPLAPLAFTPH